MVMDRRWTNKTDDWLIGIYGGKWWWGGLKCVAEMNTIEIVNKWSVMLCSVLRGLKALSGFSVGTGRPTSLSLSQNLHSASGNHQRPMSRRSIVTSRHSHQRHFLLVFLFFKILPILTLTFFLSFYDSYTTETDRVGGSLFLFSELFWIG